MPHFAHFQGMTGFGTSRRETTKMVDSNHPEYDHEASIDQTTIPSQMGSNKYASQKGMTGFGQPRWEVTSQKIYSKTWSNGPIWCYRSWTLRFRGRTANHRVWCVCSLVPTDSLRSRSVLAKRVFQFLVATNTEDHSIKYNPVRESDVVGKVTSRIRPLALSAFS